MFAANQSLDTWPIPAALWPLASDPGERGQFEPIGVTLRVTKTEEPQKGIMAQGKNRQWLLARRPKGALDAADFRLSESAIPEPADGEILVRNLYLSCDPTQRGWMARDTYVPAIPLGDVIRSSACGEVVLSRDPHFSPGQKVKGLFGWQEYAVAKQSQVTPIFLISDEFPITTGLSLLGITGMTAYFGLLDVGRPKQGETVVVSGAAGATGSVVGQIAKILGCRVVGVAGGKEKCDHLVRELGFDAAIDYKNEDVITAMQTVCPAGIDVYFDNVGGPILDAALAFLAMRGRVVICGAISTYNDPSPGPGPKNYMSLLVRRGRMEGFLVLDYLHRAAEAVGALSGWLREGKLKDRVDVVEGFENAPAALARLFKGENMGKQLVKIG
jgi:NADPH-dependent curcumin reductase CurA